MIWLVVLLKILAAYVLVDLWTGLYHLATDSGLNFRNQVEMFQDHHDTNTMQGFDWQTFAAGMPIAVLGAWFHSPFVVAIGCFVALSQVTHYYAHRRSSSAAVHRVVVTLQRCGVIVHPKSHQRHHSEPFNRDFCLLSGWNNFWLNRVVAVFSRGVKLTPCQ
jgi:hypothetical protein